MEGLSYKSSEQQVLGCLALFPEEFSKNISILSDRDFTNEPYKNIFRAIKSVSEESPVIDSALILNKCTDIQERTLLIECCQSVINKYSFDEHLKIIKEATSRRNIKKNIENLIFQQDYTETALQKIIDDNQNYYFSDNEKYNKKNIDNFLSELNSPKEVIYTGFSTLDRTLKGLRKGTVFIIGARPSTGKTAFALNIAENQIKQNKKTLFFTLEMTANMIYERIASTCCKIDSERFSGSELTKSEQKTITDLMNLIKEKKVLYIIDDISSIEIICNQISNIKPELVIIDFMQIITSLRRHENIRTKIDYISSELKRTAKKTNTCIILLSQLTRNNKEAPTMADLKESGGLEQDGDYIALLHRPYVLNKNDNSILPETTQLLLDKNKFGKTGVIDLHFNGNFQRFTELQRLYENNDLPFDT